MFASFSSAASQAATPGGGIPSGRGGTTATSWHPTVLYLVGLLVAEFVAVGLLSHYLLKE